MVMCVCVCACVCARVKGALKMVFKNESQMCKYMYWVSFRKFSKGDKILLQETL